MLPKVRPGKTENLVKPQQAVLLLRYGEEE